MKDSIKSVKRFFVFTIMFTLSIPDFVLALYNLFLALTIYCTGWLMGAVTFGKHGRLVKLYGRNIALSLDQFIATKAMGQDPDVSISMALGVAKRKSLDVVRYRVARWWLMYGVFVDWLFSFDPNHIDNAIEVEEKAEATVIHLYQVIDNSQPEGYDRKSA